MHPTKIKISQSNNVQWYGICSYLLIKWIFQMTYECVQWGIEDGTKIILLSKQCENIWRFYYLLEIEGFS